MNFLLEPLYNIAINNRNKTKIFLFSIGSYPHRPESNHENPKIFQDITNQYSKHPYMFDIYRILIDPIYNSDDIMLDNIKKKFDSNTFIFNTSITNRDYYALIDFANFISKNNCLSIIMEFTSLTRQQIDNISQYVYVTPCDCLANTDDILYNPIIEYNVEAQRYIFYNLENRLILFDEYHKTCQKVEFDFNKLLYIRELIKINFKNIDEIYRKMLNFMKVKEDIDTCFDKKSDLYYVSRSRLSTRMCGYNYYRCETVLNDFEKSDFDNLELYLKNIINNILYDCCYLEKTDTCSNVAECNKNISFEADDKLLELIKHYRTYFETK